MSSDKQVLDLSQQVTKLFENMMSELQINFLVSLVERVSDMEETLASSSENMSEMI